MEKTVELIRNSFSKRKYTLVFDKSPQRFSRISQAIKYAENMDYKVINKVPVEPKKLKFNHNWQ